MARARNWEGLTAAYRNRLARNGITKASYESGVSVKAARGHSHDDTWREFKKTDGHHIVRDFDKLPFAEKKKVARLWKLGFMSPGHHTDEQAEARIDFRGWMKEHEKHDLTKEDWETYKDAYKNLFGGG